MSATAIFIGLAMVAAGVCMVKFSFALSNFAGRMWSIEKWTGSGTTNDLYKILGVVVIFMGLLVATGFGNNLMMFLLSPLLSLFGQVNTQ